MRSQALEFRLCPHCTALTSISAKRCMCCNMCPDAVSMPQRSHHRVERGLPRRRHARMAAERATFCPACDIYLPAWAEQCYCCGWSRPEGVDMRTALRYLIQSAERKVQRIAPCLASRRPTLEDLCPHCDVCVPPSDSLCMICGWKPDRKRSLRDAWHALQQEQAHRAVQARRRRVQVCEHCDLPLLPGDGLCMACGWRPAPGRLRRMLLAHHQS